MTESSGPLSFSVEADLDPAAHWWRTDLRSSPHEPLAPPAGIYGFESLREIYGEEDVCGAPALQEPGTVMTPDGRLFAFPTVMQHRTEEYRLLDPSRPGRVRFPRLYLVGPQYRICSTRNTPPQQHSWCADAGLSGFPREKYIMPPELVRCVEDMVGDFPTGEEEAIRQRYELREERREQRRIFDEEVQRYYFSD
ncbi:hypothetical protein LEL_06242 [Akanthomyces lecanii RCEF 1005]|uniref:DUF4246 domain-containing protein n=1 Tax=Akanthomyces lecanii RCEF 1005 TaxID=1081108 RepID=A0A162KL42_CORDF|nr:hypothetical protein LEL_06242 [Akanthomyces lecanii RCEF 1005]